MKRNPSWWSRLTAPQAANPDEARREYMTKVVLFMMGVTLLPFTVLIGLGWLRGLFDFLSIVIMLTISGTVVMAWGLAQAGHWRWGSYIPPALFWGLGVYLNSQAGLWTTGNFYIIAILLTAMLHGIRSQWYVMALCIGMYLFFAWGPTSNEPLDVRASSSLTMTGVLIGVALLQWFSTRLLQQALTQSRAYAAELEQYHRHLEQMVSERTAALALVNRELEQARAELEQRVQERTASLAAANEQLEEEIRERRRAEIALRERESLLLTTIESLPFDFFALDATGHYILQNPINRRHNGDLLGRSTAEAPVDPAIRSLWQQNDQRALAGETISGEVSYAFDGEARFYHSIVSPVRDGERILGIIGVNIDITERKKAEAALRESEERLRTLINAMPDIVCFKDGQGRWLEANDFDLQLFQLTGVNYKGKTDCELAEFSPFYREAFLTCEATDELAWQAGGPSRGDEIIPRPDGPDWVFDLIKVPMFYPDGRRKGLVVIGRDITERKRAEEAMQASAEKIRSLQQLLQSISDSMPSALIVADPEERILLWNPAAERLTGVTATQGQPLWETSPLLLPYRRLYEQAVHSGERVHRRREMLPAPQGTVYHDVDIFPLRGVTVEGVALRLDDVTQQVQLEEMMLQSAKLASLGGLAAGVAHEINNPLAIIMQSAQLLQRAFDVAQVGTRARLQTYRLDPEALGDYLQDRHLQEYLAGIRSAGARAARIVADLLSFSRKADATIATYDLNALLEQTLNLATADYDLKKEYDFRDLQIIYQLTPDLPPLVGDGSQIQQVILNLVRNAAQAMAEKKGQPGYQPRLIVRTLRQGEWLRLEIEDNGPGVPPAIRERLFEPFFTTKKVGEGTGLGLWLCWAIVVERHQGHIWAEPVATEGTCFIVELPPQPPSSQG